MTPFPPEVEARLEALFAALRQDIEQAFSTIAQSAYERGVAAERARVRDGLIALAGDVVAKPPVRETTVRLEEGDLVDAATLTPLTRPQMDAFKVIVGARGAWMSTIELNRLAKNGGAASAIYAVEKKGYIRSRQNEDGKKVYDVAVFGAPRVIEQTISEPPPPPAPAPAEVDDPPVHTENVHEDVENDDGDADLDDLTKSTRDVLLAMFSVGDNAHMDQIATLAETPADRVPGAIQRLAELKLAHRIGGKWSLTEAGAAMALKVKEDEA